MTMFEKKDPPQAPENDALQDDNAIIDLTEEVVINTEEDHGIIELTDDLDEDTPVSDDKDKSFEDEEDEDADGPARTDKIESHDDDFTFDPDHYGAGDEGTMREDRIIASAVAESQGPEADDNQELAEEFDRNALEDDDVVIVDNSQDEMDEGLSGMTDGHTGDTQRDEDLFDHEEKLELEYELDEDEDELIELDDERADDDQDFVNIFLSDSKESDRSDHSDEPAEFLELDSEESDDLTDLDAEPESEPEMIAAMDDEAPEFGDNDDLSDLDTATGLEFAEDEDIVALADEEPAEFERDGGLLDLGDTADLEEFDLDNLDTDNKDDVIEITEFDEHFPADNDTLLEQTGMLDIPGDEEEDFLELIDVEEDNLSQDEEIKDFDDTAGKDEYSEVDRFLSDGLEEDDLLGVATEPIFSKDLEDKKLEKESNESVSSDVLEGNEPQDEALEPIFGDAPGEEDGPEEEIMEGDEEVLAATQESAVETETLFSENEDFKFNFEPGAFSRQVDRLDSILAEDAAHEPDVASSTLR